VITNDRKKYVAAHVTEKVHEALQLETKRQEITRSMLIYKILRKALKVKE
jgi:hypothetical protein